MSYREVDFVALQMACDQWLKRHEAKVKELNENINRKWYEFDKPKTRDNWLWASKQKVIGLLHLCKTDIGMNRIVRLSSEDAYILFDERKWNDK
jgi:hypothetical protein